MTTSAAFAEPAWWQEPFAAPAPRLGPAASASVQVQVLGEVRALVDGRPVDLGGLMPERVLLALALSAPRAATVERLVDAIWHAPPPTAAKAVRVHIGRLRRTLGDDVIETCPGGYRLAPHVLVDRLEYLDLRAASRAAVAAADELRLLTDALACWSDGDPTVGTTTTTVEEAQRSLAQLRCEDEERHSDLLLAEGLEEHDLATLRARCDLDPFRERRWEQLLRGLVDAGRPAEAIEAFRRCRSLFGDEFGLPPGPGVQAEYDRAVAADLGTATFLECRAPLVGRDDDLGRLDRVLRDHTRVTVVGPPGIGKTQLCLELARRWRRRAEPVVVVEVPPRHRAPSMLRDLAADIGAIRSDEEAALTAILERFAGVSLAVIDGAHRNPAAVADLVEQLAAARPRLRLLVTSRSSLGIDGEVHLELGPLAVPGGTTPWAETAAALLAVRRGLAGIDPAELEPETFEDAAWTDGVPLLVEVAGRTPTHIDPPTDSRAEGFGAVLDTMDPDLLTSLHQLAALPVEASAGLLDHLGTTQPRQRALVWRGLAQGTGHPRRLRTHDAVRESLAGVASTIGELRSRVRQGLIERARRARPELGSPPDYGRLADLAGDLSALRWVLSDADTDDLEVVEHVADLLSLLGLGHEAQPALDAAEATDDPLRLARATLARARLQPVIGTDPGHDPIAGLRATEEFRRREDLAAGALLAILTALRLNPSRDDDARISLARLASELAPTAWLATMAELAVGVSELGGGTARAAHRRFAAAEAVLAEVDPRGAALAAFLLGAYDPGGDIDPLEHLERARDLAREVGDRPLAASARLVTLQHLRSRGHQPPAGVYASIADECDRAGLVGFARLTRTLSRADRS